MKHFEGFPDQVIAMAWAYADCLIKYGVDVSAEWQTVTAQREALNRAYTQGRADAIEELSKKRDAACWGCKCEKIEPSVWIPVTERLPDVFKHVLVNIPGMSPHPTVQEAFCEKNGMWYSNGFRYGADEITHWMPLPPAPKGET